MFYPDQARYARRAAEELGLRFTDLDDGNGYVFAISNGHRRVLSGAGWICSYPINNAPSYNISRDKAHTKSILRQSGINTIPGRHFFTSTSHAALRNPGHELSDAPAFASALGFPIFCKPNTGARGDYAELVTRETDLHAYIKRLPATYDAVLIEQLIKGDEYRVLIYDEKPLYYARKAAPELHGDGTQTIAELLATINATLQGTGVSPYPITAAALPPNHVPAPGENIRLTGRQNLSALGGIDHLDTNVPEKLHQCAAAACRAIGLRLGAVDIFDISPARDLTSLVVIEVNGNPTLKALEASGHLEIITSIWRAMLCELLGIQNVRP